LYHISLYLHASGALAEQGAEITATAASLVLHFGSDAFQGGIAAILTITFRLLFRVVI
jgi:hypothetical protein